MQREVPGLADRLQPALRVGFTRLTLVNKNALERLTIDMNVRFDPMKEHCSFQNLVIAELKKDRAVSRSAFVDVMRGRRLKHGSISKYCLGVMSLYPEAKRNRFKERWKELRELAE